MTKRCLDEAVLQAYIDGELSQEQAAAAAQHLAACDSCAAALSEVEEQSAFFASAFGPDETLSVPTEILRSRIGAAVAQFESRAEPNQRRSQGRSLGGFFASLAGLFSFTPQRAAAFASLLVVVAVGIVYFTAQRSRPTPGGTQDAPVIARVDKAPEQSPAATATPERVATPDAADRNETAVAPVVRANYSPRRAVVRKPAKARPDAAPAPEEAALPGEREYQTAIASLEKTIELGGDASLRPSVRVEYERNLALLDSAISQTRQVAAQNPKDKDAVGFLMAAYQSKVELLTKVADQAQVAALGR